MNGLKGYGPPQVIAISFVALISIGTILLWLPISDTDGSVGFVEALFTATSAVCVTGLGVVDTGTAFSGFGQLVILVLFQIGGLGLLTFGTFLALATGRQMGLQTRLRMQHQLNVSTVGGVVELARSVAGLVIGAEVIGALVLYTRFAGDEGAGAGAWSAFFHSVSAFNNAGFSLNADSLSGYVGDPIVNLAIAALVILGGLGFAATTDLFYWARAKRGRRKRIGLPLHTKLVVFSTLFFTAAGMTLLLVVEWANPETLGALSTPERVLASFFQSVTPRTAGFNTLDYGEMGNAGLLITMLLMFIGGNPGSTAGGIKTVTIVVLALTVWSVIRGRADVTAFGRRIATQTQIRAAAIAAIAAMTGGAAVTMLAEFEPDLAMSDLLFETVSALSTVGLSTGITAELGTPARLVLIAVMYVGRVGLLSFAVALVERSASSGVRRPAEDVVVG